MTPATQSGPALDLVTGCSPELRGLIACARQVSAPDSFELPSFNCLDWDVLLLEAEHHGLSGALYKQMDRLGIPSGHRGALEGLQRANVQRGLKLTSVLIEVMELLTSSGVTVLPYKGPALSARLFGDPALREAADLDILVPEERAPSALQALLRHGFVLLRPYAASVMGQLFCYRAEIGLVREEILIELQWRLAPRYFSVELDVPALAARAENVPLGNRRVPAMSVEDTLLVLAIHGAKHQWSSLKWTWDVDLLIRRHSSLDWPIVIRRATECGALRMLLTTLSLTRELFRTPLPDNIAAKMMSDPAVAPLTQSSFEMIASGTQLTEFQHHKFMLRLRERAWDRVRYVRQLAYQPTESEWDAIAFPAGLQWLYHGVRLGRVLAKSLAWGWAFTSSHTAATTSGKTDNTRG